MPEAKRRPWTGLVLVAAIAGLGAAAEGDSLPDDAVRPLWTLENVLQVSFLAIVVIGIVWLFFVRRRLARFRTAEDLAALQLEAQVGSLVAARHSRLTGSAPSPAAPFPPPLGAAAAAPPSPAIATSPTAALGAAPPVAGPTSALPAAGPTSAPPAAPDAAIEAILAKLRAAALFSGIEGAVYLSDGRTEGKIVRLTNGKVALVLPQLESGEFLARQTKRFDFCLAPLAADQVGVLLPLGAWIADHFSMS